MPGLNAFNDAKETLSWADKALVELKADFERFFSDSNCRQVVELNPDTGLQEGKLVFHQPLAQAVRQRITESILHIKHAFDQIAFGACVAIRKPPKKVIYYPWAANPDPDLTTILDKRGFPPELWEPFLRQKPYPTGEGYAGGDDVVRALATIANRKHTIGIIPAVAVVGANFRVAVFSEDFRLAAMRWDPVKNEIVTAYGVDLSKANANYQLQLCIAFDEPPPLQGENAISSIRAFRQSAQQALDDLIAHCTTLGAS